MVSNCAYCTEFQSATFLEEILQIFRENKVPIMPETDIALASLGGSLLGPMSTHKSPLDLSRYYYLSGKG